MTKIYFGTNRKPNRKSNPTDFGGEFSDMGLANLRFGSAQVDLAGAAPAIDLDVYPEVTPKTRVKPDFLGDVQRRMADEGADVIVFVHGFNVSFTEALVSAARMKEAYTAAAGRPFEVVVFSWPSNGEVLHYRSDRKDAEASGYALTRGLEFLFRFLARMNEEEACEQRLHLVCHSMGNYALRWAVQAMKEERRVLPRVFEEIILAAADEDDDCFEHDFKLGDLPALGQRVTVLFNRNDWALGVSDLAKGNMDRLGASGARRPRMVHHKISLVDCTDVVRGRLRRDPIEHGYFLDQQTVVGDIGDVLRGLASDQIGGRRFIAEKNVYRLG
ncbi:MAG: alpha/beta fold hydrolase [Pseudomonadales bacterium]|nr:alpha/beta fold hydrolase [Pseudomonadales bacterium]